MRRKFCRSALVLLATGALATSGAALAQEQEQQQEQVQPQQQANTLPPGQVPAVLKARQADFTYRSSSRLLTCEQVRSRVAVPRVAQVGPRTSRQDVHGWRSCASPPAPELNDSEEPHVRVWTRDETPKTPDTLVERPPERDRPK